MILDKYELMELIADDEERKSFKARDISSSRNVIVHVLRSLSTSSPAKPDLAELAKSLFRSGGVSELLFAGEREGTFYIVCESRIECQDVRKWLERQFASKSRSSSSDDMLGKAGIWKVPRTTAPSTSEPGEFTRMFQNPTAGAEHDANIQAEDKLPPVDGPGEFTRIFSTPAGSSDVRPELTSSPMERTPQPHAPDPGEFTRMFQERGPSPPSAPTSPSPGEFTRLFQTPSPPAAPVVDYLKDIPGSAPGSKTEPGEFTRLFTTGAVPDAAKNKGVLSDGVIPSASRLEFPNAFPPIDNPPVTAPQNPVIASAPPAGKEAATGIFRNLSAAESPVVVQQPAAPSDFTRVISVPPRPPEPAPSVPAPPQIPNPAPPSSPQASTPAASYLPLILILNGLFVLAVLLIVYFALKK